MIAQGSTLLRLALVLGATSIAIGSVSLVGLFWVIGQTDTGTMCDTPYSEAEQPPACSVYAAPWLGLAGSVVLLAAAAGVTVLRLSIGRQR